MWASGPRQYLWQQKLGLDEGPCLMLMIHRFVDGALAFSLSPVQQAVPRISEGLFGQIFSTLLSLALCPQYFGHLAYLAVIA